MPEHTIRSIYGQREYQVPAGHCVVRIDDITHDVAAAKTEAARVFHRQAGVPPLRHLVAQTAERVTFSEHFDPREDAMRRMKR